ncbi:MAG: TetR/AcrR family transcriptional regulator [Sporichthyaceae bacterium]
MKLRTVDKRMAGRRARETRDRILESLGTLLGSMSYRDVRVTDVVREVGTSPATFYQYFADVETAVLALAQDVVKDAAGLKSLAEGASMTGKAAVASVDKIVDGIGAFYKKNEAVLRVLDVAASEGAAPFKKARAALSTAVAAPLVAVGADKANAAAAAALIAATSGSRAADGGVTAAELRAAVGKQVFWAITGRKA